MHHAKPHNISKRSNLPYFVHLRLFLTLRRTFLIAIGAMHTTIVMVRMAHQPLLRWVIISPNWKVEQIACLHRVVYRPLIWSIAPF